MRARAFATASRSISATITPGSSPAFSASTSPQGECVSVRDYEAMSCNAKTSAAACNEILNTCKILETGKSGCNRTEADMVFISVNW